MVRRTLDRVAEAGITIVSLPMCNLYLQDRVARRTPRLRGVTLAHEIRARGIELAFASDNCRDPFSTPMAITTSWRCSARRCASRISTIRSGPAAVTTVPAKVMRLPAWGGLKVGGPADLLIFEGRDWSEVLSRPETGRIVLRAGRPIDTALPAYDELDHLCGAC